MDSVTLAATAVTVLGPYLAEAGRATAKTIGTSVGDAVPKPYQASSPGSPKSLPHRLVSGTRPLLKALSPHLEGIVSESIVP